MPHGIARRAQLARIVAAAIGLVLFGACDSFLGIETPLPPPAFKPVVTFLNPANGTSVSLGDTVPVDAATTDGSGILRVDFLVNGAVVDSQSLFVAARRFEYQNTWRPTGDGKMTLTIVAYNVNNIASDPVSVSVNVSGTAPTATGVPPTATQTPFVIFVTSTPPPATRAIVTPIVTVITATPLPTSTRTPAALLTQTITVTATVSQTATVTLTRQLTPAAAVTETQTSH
jgi:Big-like domain-containing protein